VDATATLITVWRNYLAGFARAGDRLAWTYEFYLADAETNTAPPLVATIGCFSYQLQAANLVRLHFQNADTSGYSPLHASRVEQRRSELSRLFAHVKRAVGLYAEVTGTSWLYNLASYRRLFPEPYVASGTVVQRLRSMPQWGQFVDHTGRIKAAPAQRFRAAVAAVSSITRLPDAFPLQPLAARAPIQCFYDHHGV